MRRLLLVVGVVIAAVSAFPGRAMAFGGAPTGGITTATQNSVVASYTFDDGTSNHRIRVYLAFATARNDKSAVPQAPAPPAANCSNANQSFDCGSANLGDQWPLKYNGPYQVNAIAESTFGVQTPSASDTKTFTVAIPPAIPSGLKATYDDKAHGVSLSWTANPEPDISGYELQRKAPGDSKYATVGLSAKPSFVDNQITASGAYSYQVIAHRYADSAKPVDQAGDVTSPSSSATSATVPASAVPTTAPPASGSNGSPDSASGSGSAAASNSSSSSASAQAGKVDLKGFAAMLDKARKTGKQQIVVEGPDPGFKEALPFKPGDQEAGTDTTEVLNQTVPGIHAKSSQRPALLFIAGSLLATVLLMHLLWLRSEVNRTGPLEAELPLRG